VILTPTNRWKAFFLAYLSRPAADRFIYRAIMRGKIGRIVELGIGDGRRALRMIAAAARHLELADIQYAGIDPFEGREAADGPGLPLIEAHRLLKQSGAKIKLVPGDPCQGLIRSANALANADLLLISSSLDAERLRPMWFFVPRMLHARSLVLWETAGANGTKSFCRIGQSEIAAWASESQRRKAA
jgi:hypothetical protein